MKIFIFLSFLSLYFCTDRFFPGEVDTTAYLEKFTNQKVMDKLYAESLSNKFSTFQRKSLEKKLKEREQFNNTQEWEWPFAPYNHQFILPQEINEETDTQKWIRIVGLLKSMEFTNSIDKNFDSMELNNIMNPPIMNKLEEIDDAEVWVDENLSYDHKQEDMIAFLPI